MTPVSARKLTAVAGATVAAVVVIVTAWALPGDSGATSSPSPAGRIEPDTAPAAATPTTAADDTDRDTIAAAIDAADQVNTAAEATMLWLSHDPLGEDNRHRRLADTYVTSQLAATGPPAVADGQSAEITGVHTVQQQSHDSWQITLGVQVTTGDRHRTQQARVQIVRVNGSWRVHHLEVS